MPCQCCLQVQQPWSRDHCQVLTEVLDRAALFCGKVAVALPQVVTLTILVQNELQKRLSLSIARLLAWVLAACVIIAL